MGGIINMTSFGRKKASHQKNLTEHAKFSSFDGMIPLFMGSGSSIDKQSNRKSPTHKQHSLTFYNQDMAHITDKI